MSQLIPKNSKDLPGFRAFLNTQRDQWNSTAAVFTGPIKEAMQKVVTDITEWISKLPATDAVENWSLDCSLDYLFNMLTQAAAAAQLASLELAKATNGEQMNAAVNAAITAKITAGDLIPRESLDVKVTEQLNARVTAGDLVPKANHEQLCASAKQIGFGEGELKAKNDVAAEKARVETLNARKALLQTNSLPLPETDIEKILGGTDDEFNARRTRFETRKAELAEAKIQLNSDDLLVHLWGEDAEYTMFERMVKRLPAMQFNANPLASGGGAPTPAQTSAVPTLVGI